ncbi:ADP-ribose pyrophosphatase-like protein [Leptotrombidium deliense]|uniref:ADP-ribose pyrophosphatase-like protein n=1 Tax=Leptotrombidium deliense TaxID=299467 RepID=A0A443SB28_9ACAR|nr:ADP-ribose pyrophosphatase-like protein [Leptotrombidium deliense]
MPSNQFSQTGEQNNTFSNGSPKMQGDQQKTCKPTKEVKIYSGKSINLTKFHFEDTEGNERVQEGIQRTRKSTSNALGQRNVCTIGILKRQIMCDSLVLVKQYRAPLKAYTLEFPARVIEPQGANPNFEDIINREIEDDTGYTSTDIKHISPLTALDPVRLVSLLIDGDDPLQHPSPKSLSTDSDSEDNNNGHGQVVEVLQVPINGLLDRLNEYSKQGLVVDSRVYAFAIGLKKGEKLALSLVVPPMQETMY